MSLLINSKPKEKTSNLLNHSSFQITNYYNTSFHLKFRLRKPQLRQRPSIASRYTRKNAISPSPDLTRTLQNQYHNRSASRSTSTRSIKKSHRILSRNPRSLPFTLVNSRPHLSTLLHCLVTPAARRQEGKDWSPTVRHGNASLDNEILALRMQMELGCSTIK